MLLNAGDPPPLAAAVPFYGTLQNEDFSKTRAAVMAVYAENDQRVNATRETAKSALERAGLQHDVKTYPGVNHAFMNNTGANYNEAQANAAYQAMIDWFGRHLG
jgi:carboxymethylenebutenolidase